MFECGVIRVAFGEGVVGGGIAGDSGGVASGGDDDWSGRGGTSKVCPFL